MCVQHGGSALGQAGVLLTPFPVLTFYSPLPCHAITDCGRNPNTTSIVVNVRADFTGHPSISPRVLMNNAKGNLCLEDEARRKRGEADLCW